jgi:hypothetical protein
MQVIGLCRFSYPAIGGFQVVHPDIAARTAYLYAPDRMEDRFAAFETLTLPALRGQTDGDFTFVVVVGDSMPAVYRERLDALLADMPQAVISAHPPRRHRKIMQHAVNAVRRFDGDPCLQFRMDDDDAVASVYVERLRQAAGDVRKLAARHPQIAIDFNQGYIVRPGPLGLKAAPSTQSYTAAALAIMLRPKNRLSVMNFAHARVARNMPTVTMTGEDMSIRGHNDHNDSRQKPGVKVPDFALLDATGEAHFRNTYNIDADHVRRVFGRIANT